MRKLENRRANLTCGACQGARISRDTYMPNELTEYVGSRAEGKGTETKKGTLNYVNELTTYSCWLIGLKACTHLRVPACACVCTKKAGSAISSKRNCTRALSGVNQVNTHENFREFQFSNFQIIVITVFFFFLFN